MATMSKILRWFVELTADSWGLSHHSSHRLSCPPYPSLGAVRTYLGPDPSISGVQAHTAFDLRPQKESVLVPTDLTDIHTGTLIPFVLT